MLTWTRPDTMVSPVTTSTPRKCSMGLRASAVSASASSSLEADASAAASTAWSWGLRASVKRAWPPDKALARLPVSSMAKSGAKLPSLEATASRIDAWSEVMSCPSMSVFCTSTANSPPGYTATLSTTSRRAYVEAVQSPKPALFALPGGHTRHSKSQKGASPPAAVVLYANSMPSSV
eukprot:339213-Rhodomonas_salina.2